jgi:hypothetical protein
MLIDAINSSVEFKIANLYHIDGILALQELYLVDNLSTEQKQAGFVTTRFTTDQLKVIIGESKDCLLHG